MTDPQFTALLQSLPSTITAIGVIVVGVLAAMARKRDTKADEKQDKQSEVINEIHTVTNSNLSAITSDLKQALSKIDGLEKRIVSMDKAKGVADAVAKELADKHGTPVIAEVVVAVTPSNETEKPKPK